MAREHRLTHPILGPATWKQMQAAAAAQRQARGRVCTWCHGDIPRSCRTRCASPICQEMLTRAIYWPQCTKLCYRAAGGKCQNCGGQGAEVDHIVPVSLGGLGDQDNLRLLCVSCHKVATAALRRRGAAYLGMDPFCTGRMETA